MLTDSNGVPTYVPQYGQTAVSLSATSDIGTQQQYSGRIEYDFGPVQLTSLTAWNKSEGTNFQDLSAIFGFLAGFYEAPDGSTVTIDDAAVAKKFSQELRLTFDNGGAFSGTVRTPLFERTADGGRQRVFTTGPDGERVPAFVEKNKFFNAQNLAQLAKDTSFTAIMAVGMAVVSASASACLRLIVLTW